MCKSKAEGGQRCYAHARPAYDKALAGHKAAMSAVEDASTMAATFADSDSPSDVEHHRVAMKVLRQAEHAAWEASERLDDALRELASTKQGYQDLMAEADTIEQAARGKSGPARREAIWAAEGLRAAAKAGSGRRTLREKVAKEVRFRIAHGFDGRLK